MWQIIGWIIWSVTTLLAITGIVKCRKTGRSENGFDGITGILTFSLWLISILFLVFDWNKLHILWTAPIVLLLIPYLMRKEIPIVSPTILTTTAIFLTIILAGIKANLPGSNDEEDEESEIDVEDESKKEETETDLVQIQKQVPPESYKRVRSAESTMKSGRNDPCPCGSGKKYKKCCLLKEKASATSLTHPLLRKTADQIPGLLLAYGKKLYGEEGILEAWDDFWAGTPEEDFNFESPYLQFFTPWFMYHWYSDDELNPEFHYPCEHTIVAQFLKKKGWTLDALTKRYLESAQKEPISFWQIEAVEPGKGLLLKDLALERECFVHEVSATKILKKWDIILSQVVGLEGEYILSATGPYGLPARNFRDAIVESIKPKKKFVHEPTDLLLYDVDFIWLYHDCVERLLNPPIPEIRNTDNEELVFTTARFTFDPAYRQEIIEKLKAMRNIEYHGEQENEEEFGWVVYRKEAMLESTIKGKISVGSDYLLTECNSKPRDKKLRERLLKHLGDFLSHEDTSYKDYDPGKPPDAPDKAGPLDLNELPEEARQQVVGLLEQEHMRWMEKEIPVLHHKTPREAVKTPQGREHVIALINDWENAQLRMPNPQFRFDFNKLRKELGLEVD